MSETKFTKGLWQVSDIKINGEHAGGSWSVNVDGSLLANVTSGATFGVVDDIQKANANLIACAPDMYEMLERVMCNYQVLASVAAQSGIDFNEYKEDLEAAEQLLKRARGEQC